MTTATVMTQRLAIASPQRALQARDDRSHWSGTAPTRRSRSRPPT